MKFAVLALFIFLAGSAYMMSPWHQPAPDSLPPLHFGYATVATVTGSMLCVGDFKHCRLQYGPGDRGPRITVCHNQTDAYWFCPVSKGGHE